jgi:SOS-response transcriptional repressor LexA
MTGTTPKQQECLDFIERFIAEHGYSPSLDEIAAGLKYRSRTASLHLVRKLAERGRLSFMPRRSRSISLINTS